MPGIVLAASGWIVAQKNVLNQNSLNNSLLFTVPEKEFANFGPVSITSKLE